MLPSCQAVVSILIFLRRWHQASLLGLNVRLRRLLLEGAWIESVYPLSVPDTEGQAFLKPYRNLGSFIDPILNHEF